MPFNRPSLKDLVNRVLAGIKSRLTTEQLRRSDAEVYAREIAGASHELHGHLDFISAQVIYDTAESDYLDRWATLWLTQPRIPAAAASGNVIVTGTDGTVIEAGKVFVSGAGVEYSVETDATVVTGNALVAVRAVLGRNPADRGSLGNLAVGETLTLTETIPGIAGAATVATGGLSGGADQEDDASLRARLINRIQEPPHGGSANDYITWALEVPGVTRAWVYPQELGPGTVTIRFMRDDDDDPIPDAGEVATVQAYIDERRPVTVKECFVAAPIPVQLDFEMSVTPNTSAVRDAVQAELEDLIRREAVPGGGLLLSHINEAISLAPGETDHVLVDPSADVTTGTGQILTMGTITWL
ncbi:baseplate J/gp47 family protein [Methylobacillus pratensis]